MFWLASGACEAKAARISSTVIKAALSEGIYCVTHSDVSQVAVIGLPDEKWGEVIAAFILSDHPLKMTDLRTHCRAHLSAQKTPSVWVHVPDFPLTGSGKVQKFAIRDKFLAGNYGEILQ